MPTKPIRIIRGVHDSDNKYFVSTRLTPQDRDLSWEARGVLWYLLSKADTWELQPKDLQQGCGRDKVYKILAELQAAGYVIREEVRDENQKFVAFIYKVYEHPFPENPQVANVPLPENTEMGIEGEPFPDLPDTANTDIKELKSSTELERKEEKTPAPEKRAGTPRPRNPMYDAILKVWKYTAAMNGLMAKMLAGTATKAGWKEYNLETPLTPADLVEWAAWYRKTELHGDPNLNMLEERAKIQSSITFWQERRAKQLESQRLRAEADRQWADQHPDLYPDGFKAVA